VLLSRQAGEGGAGEVEAEFGAVVADDVEHHARGFVRVVVWAAAELLQEQAGALRGAQEQQRVDLPPRARRPARAAPQPPNAAPAPRVNRPDRAARWWRFGRARGRAGPPRARSSPRAHRALQRDARPLFRTVSRIARGRQAGPSARVGESQCDSRALAHPQRVGCTRGFAARHSHLFNAMKLRLAPRPSSAARPRCYAWRSMPRRKVTVNRLLGGVIAVLGIAAWGPPRQAEASMAAGATASQALQLREACIPREECCRVCSQGKACGDSCIRANFKCHKGNGCACDEEDVCN